MDCLEKMPSLLTLIWRKLFGGESWGELIEEKTRRKKKQSNDTYPPTHKYLGETHFTRKFFAVKKLNSNLKERLQLDEEVARYIYVRKFSVSNWGSKKQ